MSPVPMKIAPSTRSSRESIGVRNAHNGATFKDLTGVTFGRLTAVVYLGRKWGQNAGAIWFCRCSCDGNEKEYRATRLHSEHTRSCGCLRVESLRERNRVQSEVGALARVRAAVERAQLPKLLDPVAIYELIDPRGEPWIYVGASARPVHRYSQHCSGGSLSNLRMRRWIDELRRLELRPDIRVQGWVERDVAGEVELRAIAAARRQFKRYCLNTRRSPAYGHIYELKSKPPRLTYGLCRTSGCSETATHSTGWCDSCYQIRGALRDEAKRRTGSATTPRGSGTGLCHDCRDPISFDVSRCNECKIAQHRK